MTWREAAEERLRGAGYRSGAARSAVVGYLDAQTCCRGAQEIHAALRAGGANVGLASVYRTLETLVDHGLAQRVDVGDGIVRFEAARPGGEHHHHHLVCASCGRVEQFSDDALETAITAIEQRSGYSLTAHDVVLHGSCEACRA